MNGQKKRIKILSLGISFCLLLSGCAKDWSGVIIVDEGNGSVTQVGIEQKEVEFETRGTEAETQPQEVTEAETEAVPVAEITGTALARLDISAESYCVLDMDTLEIVAAYRPLGKYAPASITKILTALVVAENCPDLSKKVTVIRSDIESISMFSSSMTPMIREDEQMTVQDLLYGMILESSNACAAVLARYVAGDEKKFAKLMNKRAAQAGATDSHFVNPHGLDHENHYVTARDMALIMRDALRNPVTALLLSTANYTVSADNLFGTRELSMGHGMVNGSRPVEGAYAGKTGFTLNAGYTMVTAAKRNGRGLIAVTLGSRYGSNYEDMETVIEFGFSRINGTEYTPRPAAYYPRLAEMNEDGFTLKFNVSENPAGVQCAVWSTANGQDDIVWYDCGVNETLATAHIPMADHGYETGRYEAHCFVTDAAGNQAVVPIQLLVTGRNLEKGVVQYAGNAYYVGEDGRLRFGFIESPEGCFYADSEGRLQTGITGTDECKTLAGADYRIAEGFIDWEGHTYYVQKSGELMTGRCSINRKGYLFDLVSCVLIEE